MDAKNTAGLTALHVAARARSLAVVRLLLASGCDGSLTDASGRAALHYAAQTGEWLLFSALYAHPACAVMDPDDRGEPVHRVSLILSGVACKSQMKAGTVYKSALCSLASMVLCRTHTPPLCCGRRVAGHCGSVVGTQRLTWSVGNRLFAFRTCSICYILQ